MNFRDLLRTVGEEPIFETGLLLAGDIDPFNISRQLVRWKNGGKIIQLRRGIYTLAPPYQKVQPHPFLLANRLVEPSYISLQSALAHYGMIPEFVPVVTSITTDRPYKFDTPLGQFKYHHVKTAFFYGFNNLRVTRDQSAYIAKPEKALLDLVYLQPGGNELEYLRELRLQNMDQFDTQVAVEMAKHSGSIKLQHAINNIVEILQEVGEHSYETLSD